MQCPRCSNELTVINVEGIDVDICENGCGGVWFDAFEFKKFDEPSEPAGEELLNVLQNPNIRVDQSQRIKCPKCDNIVMMRHFFSIKQQVEIDECPGCAGIWLDAGELAHIRELFESEEARLQAAEEVFYKTFGSEMASQQASEEELLAKARRFANFFKWICPTAYIPGKQSWGAF